MIRFTQIKEVRGILSFKDPKLEEDFAEEYYTKKIHYLSSISLWLTLLSVVCLGLVASDEFFIQRRTNITRTHLMEKPEKDLDYVQYVFTLIFRNIVVEHISVIFASAWLIISLASWLYFKKKSRQVNKLSKIEMGEFTEYDAFKEESLLNLPKISEKLPNFVRNVRLVLHFQLVFMIAVFSVF
jgi:hypothetical protein